jgi:hypothetical protein
LSRVLFDVKNLTRAQAAFNLLNTLGIWLPIIAIVLLGIGVAVAKGHLVPWSAPPSGSRWACWCWLCRWRCSGRSTWTPSGRGAAP